MSFTGSVQVPHCVVPVEGEGKITLLSFFLCIAESSWKHSTLPKLERPSRNALKLSTRTVSAMATGQMLAGGK